MRISDWSSDVCSSDLNLNPVKGRLGVPYGKGSCHTAEVGGYVVEGHVPADDVKRLLAQQLDAKGLVLPGMPLGSPGMEMPGGQTEPYTVESVTSGGTTEAFDRHCASSCLGTVMRARRLSSAIAIPTDYDMTHPKHDHP